VADRIIGRLAYKIVGDDREFKKALQRSTRELDKTADRFQQIGGRLSLMVTAPIVAAGGAAVRAASDLEESLNAVNVVFGDSAGEITAWGENAATQAGLAQSEFNAAAVRLGASLKNAGIPLDEVAGSTINLTQRAADLASVFGGDVNEALGAIASALRGEADPIERFGATVNAAAVEAKALELGLAGSTGEITEQIKVQARLAVIMEQTADVQGDFANTIETTANAVKVTRAEVTDLAAELGQELLPIAQAVIQNVLELVQEFKDLDDTQKDTIIRVAAVAAAMGPLSVGIGTAIKAVNALRLAAVALGGASGLGLVVLAVGAVATAVRVIRGPIREARESLDELAGASGDTAKELDEVARALSESEQFSQNFKDVERNVRQIAEASGRTVDEVIAVGLATSRVSDEYKAQLATLQDQVDEQRENASVNEDLSDIYRQQREMVEAINESHQSARDAAVERAAAEQAALEAQREARSEAWQETLTEYYRTQEGQLEILERKLRDYQFALANPDSDLGVRSERGIEVVRTIVSELEEEIQRRRESLGLVDDQNDSLEELTDRQLNQLYLAERNAQVTADHADEMMRIPDYMEATAKNAESMADFQESAIASIGAGWGQAFEALGESIVNAESGFESLKEAAKGVAIAILRGLGEELVVRAAVALIPGLSFNPVAAAGYAAASAAAFGAAGAISAFGVGGSFVADQPTLAIFGENGPETVDIQPVPKVGPPGAYAGGGTEIHVHGDLYGYDDFAEKVHEATSRAIRTGRVRP
jgi:hypothetical protein